MSERLPGAGRVLNPDAVGDPDWEPIVELSDELVTLLRPCACGGVNGFHGPTCSDEPGGAS